MRATVFAAALVLTACKGDPSPASSQAPAATAGSSVATVPGDASALAESPDAAAVAAAAVDAGAAAADADAGTAEASTSAANKAAAIDALAARLADGPVGILHTGNGGGDVDEGGLSSGAINAVIKESKREIRDCYARELAKHPGLNGKVVVSFEIAKTGNVTKAEVGRGTSLTNAKVTSCITGVVKKLKFPQPEGAGIARVTYPFLFTGQP